jgi:hypothetical protein
LSRRVCALSLFAPLKDKDKNQSQNQSQIINMGTGGSAPRNAPHSKTEYAKTHILKPYGLMYPKVNGKIIQILNYL